MRTKPATKRAVDAHEEGARGDDERDVIATNGTVENHLVYDAYGVLKSQTPGGYSPFVKFTGKFFDTATGLQYNHHRWYDAAVGRWISEDPIAFGGGDANFVRYVGNSPFANADSVGLLMHEVVPDDGESASYSFPFPAADHERDAT